MLDFDSFPTAPEEQISLVRFRVKKTVPFDIDSAAVSYFVQPAVSNKSGGKKVEVLAVTVALEVIARYEALFRATGFQPGVVTTSTMAALNLYHGEGVAVLAKLSGFVLTVAVLSGNSIRLFRCVTLEEASDEEILGILHPTFAYVEDELSATVAKLILCGFDRPPKACAARLSPCAAVWALRGASTPGCWVIWSTWRTENARPDQSRERAVPEGPSDPGRFGHLRGTPGRLVGDTRFSDCRRTGARERDSDRGGPFECADQNVAAEETKLDGFLRQPANAEVLERSLLLNTVARAQVHQLDQDFCRSRERAAAQRQIDLGASSADQLAERSAARHGGGREGAGVGDRVFEEAGRIAAVRSAAGPQLFAAVAE